MTTNGRRAGVVCCGRAAVLAAVWTALVWTCCADAAATAESNDWRPCRAAGHRRYDEDVHRNNVRDGPGYEDFTGGDDDGDGGETDADDDYNDDGGGSDEGYSRLPVDDKSKRGAIKQYEKKPDLHRPAAPASYPIDAAAANGMRVDTTLLRGETIELPTYVNVPVTLKCRFEPVAGTVDKFDTVVEAMYPGHRGAPPPPPSSHASRILKQLMGSVEGWRGVTHNSVRSVRRASGNRFGRREWPARGDDEVGDGFSAAQHDGGYNQVAWNILARQRAAERMRRIHDTNQDFYWPEWFQEQSARLLQQRINGYPVAGRKQSKNQLIEEQEAEQDVYDHGFDDPQVAQVYDQQIDGRQAEQGYDGQVESNIYDAKQVESADDSQQIESVDETRQVESIDDTRQVESIDDDSQQVKRFDDSQQVEADNVQMQLNGRQVERVEDRADAEEVDDRRAQGGSLPVDGQQLQLDTKAMTSPEPTTAAISDFAKFRKGIPVRTYVEHAYTTDSSL
ncbi:hypothetical protein QTP88_002384 [Uroleucon formosanum]